MLKTLRSTPRFFGQAALVSLFSFVNQFLALGIQVYVAQRFGLAHELDAYFLALALSTVFMTSLYGMFTFAYVPIFREISQSNQERATNFQSSTWWIIVIASFFLTSLCLLLSVPITHLLTSGSPELFPLTLLLFRLASPLIFFQGLLQVLLTFHIAQNRFLLSQISFPIASIFVFGLLVWFLPQLGIVSLMMSWLLAYILQDILLFLTLPLKIHWLTGLHEYKSLLYLWSNLWPLALGSLIYKGNVVYDSLIAAFLPTGEISAINYAFRLLSALVLLLSRGVSLVTLPMTTDAHLIGKQKASDLLNWSVRALLLLAIPTAVGILILGQDSIAIVFEHGAFDAEATAKVSQTLAAYMGALIALTIGGQVTNVFYAQHDSRTVVKVNLFTTLLYWILIATVGVRKGITAIALSYSLTTLVTISTLMFILTRRGYPLGWSKMWTSTGRMLLASACMAVGIVFLKLIIPQTLIGLILLVSCAVILYGVSLYLLKAPELRFLRTAKE